MCVGFEVDEKEIILVFINLQDGCYSSRNYWIGERS
jgi:hypothetical protein